MIEYYNIEPFAGAGDFVIGIAIAVCLIIMAGFIVKTSKPTFTRTYRKAMTDTYVTAKIKKLAKKDDIDLNKELKENIEGYAYFNKVLNCRKKDLDDVIELDLSDKIEEETKKLKKEKKEKTK